MTETFFPTSAQEIIPNDRDDLLIQIENLKADNMRLDTNLNHFRSMAQDLQRKINNAAGVIRDYYSENGEMLDELKDIATYLDIPLTKEICGTATFSISWTAQVPLDFEADDFEICFSAECDTVEAEDFNYDEDDTTVEAEDSY